MNKYTYLDGKYNGMGELVIEITDKYFSDSLSG